MPFYLKFKQISTIIQVLGKMIFKNNLPTFLKFLLTFHLHSSQDT